MSAVGGSIGQMTQPDQQVILQGGSGTVSENSYIAVLPSCKLPGEVPVAFIEKQHAWELVRLGDVRWDSKRRQAVRRITQRSFAEPAKTLGYVALRGLSATMPALVAERAADGSAYHRSLVETYRPQRS